MKTAREMTDELQSSRSGAWQKEGKQLCPEYS